MKNRTLANWLTGSVFSAGAAVFSGFIYFDSPAAIPAASAGLIAGALAAFHIRRQWRAGAAPPFIAAGLVSLGCGVAGHENPAALLISCFTIGFAASGVPAALCCSVRMPRKFFLLMAAFLLAASGSGLLAARLPAMPDPLRWRLFIVWAAACVAASCFVKFLWLRLIALILTHTVYRVELSGTENIPDREGALLLANHVSIVDALLVLCSTPRHIQFMIDESFFRPWRLRLLFSLLGVWKVPGRGKTKEMLALRERLREALTSGKLVAVFPEGKVSPNGVTQLFRGSVDELLGPVEVPVIPVRLGLLYGPLVTLHRGKVHLNRVLYCPMLASVMVGKPIDRHLSGFEMRQILHEMGAEAEKRRQFREKPIHVKLLANAGWFPFERNYADAMTGGITNFILAAKALILSRKIRELTGKDEEYVGVMLPNCTAAAAALFAVLFADKVPAVVNFTSGRPIREQALARAGVKTVLTSRAFLTKLGAEPEPGMVCLEDLAGKIGRCDKIMIPALLALLPRQLLGRLFFPKSRNDVSRTAVLLFSSGSSGTPKGVMLSHRNINCDFYSFFRVVGWTRRDCLLGNLPLFHAFGLTVGFWVPTMARTRVVYIPNPLDASFTGKVIARHKLTMMMATPTFLQTYMRRCTREQLSSLRLVITGGEKLRRDIAENFRRITGLAVVEGYGCTELAPIVSINLAFDTFDLGREAGKPGSIGVPMPGVFVKIADRETGRMCKPDEDGVLLVKGGLVMKGYLNDPEATALAVVDGFYNTGDIASMDERGYITITGRLSRFSKISGEMVPDELVELHLNELIGAESRVLAVTGVPDAGRGERLVVLHSVPDLDAAELVEGLRARGLPNLWLPRREDFHFVAQVPLLGSGKVDIQSVKSMALELAVRD